MQTKNIKLIYICKYTIKIYIQTKIMNKKTEEKRMKFN